MIPGLGGSAAAAVPRLLSAGLEEACAHARADRVRGLLDAGARDETGVALLNWCKPRRGRRARSGSVVVEPAAPEAAATAAAAVAGATAVAAAGTKKKGAGGVRGKAARNVEEKEEEEEEEKEEEEEEEEEDDEEEGEEDEEAAVARVAEELILRAGTDPRRAPWDREQNCLHLAATAGSAGLVRALLRHGADPWERTRAQTRAVLERRGGSALRDSGLLAAGRQLALELARRAAARRAAANAANAAAGARRGSGNPVETQYSQEAEIQSCGGHL